MRVLIIGSGGREHALAWKLATEPGVKKIFSVPGNGGLRELADCRDVPLDPISLAKLAVKEDIDLTVVGPEAPLVEGITDVFEERGLAIFGPNKAAAQLEGSKSFAKYIMNKHRIPTADAAIFSNYDKAMRYANAQELPLVIKADGLAGGKGVMIAGSHLEVESALRDCFLARKFGVSGEKVLIEEFLSGQEVSLLSFCDGKNILPMVPAQDYKRINDGDEGPNTGGMGSYSPVPVVTPRIYTEIVDTIIKPTIKGLADEGIVYRGVLYAGVILTSAGPKVLEFNVRFGDPETQSIIPRLKSELAEILLAVARHDVSAQELVWRDEKCVSLVLSSAGYPENPQIGREITGLSDAAAIANVNIFHAATKRVGDKLLTNGGRVLNISALGDSFSAARAGAYAAAELIKFDGAHYRRDIGKRAETADRGAI